MLNPMHGRSPHETLSATFAVQSADPEARTFRGMASVFGTLIDAWIPTRIKLGAFTKTLQENKDRIKVLWQHDTYQPIGKPTLMDENSDGLLVEAIVSDTQCGRDAIVLMRDKVVTELSIGFDPTRWEMIEQNGAIERHVSELTLWEFSPVTFAASRDAKIMSVHATQARRVLELHHANPALIVPEALAAFAESADQQVLDAVAFLREVHEGRVLSAKNRTLVSDARDALQKLLDASEPKDDKADEAARLALAPEAPARRDVRALLRSIDRLELDLLATS
mgnify:FL=1